MERTEHTFGTFTLAADRSILLRGSSAAALGQKGTALLKALVEAKGEVVTKDALMAAAWGNATVEEGNLTVQIAALRKAIVGLGAGGEFIMTVPRIGYRLLSSQEISGETHAAIPRLALASFRNLSADPEQDYFAAGISADIIAGLSRFRSFAVIRLPQSIDVSPEPEKAAGAGDLGVRYLLGGSIRKVGNRIRIIAQLVEVPEGRHLWAQTYDGILDDIFDFQDRITENVVGVIEPHVQQAEMERARRERPDSVAAYDIYLRALDGITSESEAGNAEAYALLQEGLAHEPDNALLLSHAAWALEHRTAMGWPALGSDDREMCNLYVRRALEHARGDAMVMAHCGIALLQTTREYDWAIRVLNAAVEANPNNLMVVARAGVGHLHCGDLQTALKLFHRANCLSPGENGAHLPLCGIAHVHIQLGEDEEALLWAGRALASNPRFDPIYWMLVTANARLGRMDEAARCLDDLRRISPGVTISRIRAGQPGMDPSRLAPILAALKLLGLPEG
ncbi:winged helix-turn-helix domain-containing tetratricopeptide repeat protein [Rhizobium herbae]|uniref:TolB-like protein/Flp pilus assembly protein TadD n=1 Tax=Rhizobium herbae TaxID=508661 RepID=A0ABS4EQR6_9HYPH|nr:winged helix-turn-helix domain-containing protein [Rhizobium herbae]MBP1860291.1 TolB-like protein/Flp pilus assembly protein TadD [Rhizobium herbae]